MGKVKKSVKKFLDKGGADAPKKANKKRKMEAQIRDKIKKKNLKDGDDASSKTGKLKHARGDNTANSIKALEEMDVSQFMNEIASDSEEENEEVDNSDEEEEDDEEEVEDEEEDDDDKDKSASDVANSDDEEEEDETSEMKASLTAHKQELEKLAEKDPEFFKFLQENNQDLLDFEGSEEEEDEFDEDDDDDDDEDEAPEGLDGEEEEEAENDDEDGEAASQKSKKAKKGKKETVVVSITLSDLRALITSLSTEHSLRGLKKLIDMYKSGCNMSNENATSKYSIPSASVFNHLMVSAIQTLHVEFAHHLSPTSSSSNKSNEGKKALTKSPAWIKMEPLLVGFFKATLTMIQAVTDMSLAGFILKQLKHYSDFMAPFPTMLKKYLKLYLQLWGESQEPDSDSRAVQVAAFFRIRQLAISMPFPFIEECLKGLYLTYVRNARFTNDQSIPVLTFMGNCIVELYGLDMKSSFSHGFVYVRQLAMVLRNAMVKKSKESLSSVFNWQFLNSLRVWSAVVAQYPGKEELQDLVFPLVQVLMGVERLGHSPRLLPFRLHCSRLLNQLAASAGVFIPVSPIILDVLVSPELHKKPVASTDLPPKFDSIIRLPEHLTAHQQDAVFNNCLELLHQNLDIYSYNPGFPEFSAPIKTALSSFAKTTKIARWRSVVKGEMDFINKQALWVTQKRATLSAGPVSASGSIESLLPTDKPNAHQRLDNANRAKTKAEQIALQNEAQYAMDQSKSKKHKKNKKKNSKQQEQDEDEDEEDEPRAKKARKVRAKQAAEEYDEDEDGDIVQEGFDWDDDEEEE